MHRVDTSTNVTVLPTPKPAGTPGYFSEGNETSGIKATYPGPDFFNSLQEEVVAPILAAGLTLSKADNTQLLQAIIAIAKLYGFSTGDAKLTFKAVADAGWVLANDGSIGNGSSSATTRANADTEALYTLLWNNIADQWCPVYDSAGAKVARGANAAADFAANRRLRLSRVLGRAIAVAGLGKWEEIFTADAGTDTLTVPTNSSVYTGARVQVSNSGGGLPGGLAAATDYYAIRLSATGVRLCTSLANAHAGTYIDVTSAGTGVHTITMSLTSRALGEHVGEEAHAQTVPEMPSHNHPGSTQDQGAGAGGGSPVCSDNPSTQRAITIAAQGGGIAHNIMSPESFMNVMIKL